MNAARIHEIAQKTLKLVLQFYLFFYKCSFKFSITQRILKF